MIFLSLRFYVKSILKNLEVLNLPFFEALNFDFSEFQPSKTGKNSARSKFRASKSVKMVVFELLRSLNWVSRKI